LKTTRGQVLAFRARASHLDAKLPAGSLVVAAHGGLQDSTPRAGVLGLHARVEDVRPDSWDDPALCQIWFRGGADYIVPRRDIAVFTLGSMTRDREGRAEIGSITDRVLEVLDGQELRVRDVADKLDLEHPTQIRLTGRSGRVLIRWNASRIWCYASEPPAMDEEDARLELVRRFLRWFGPQTQERFAWWAGVEAADAAQTWRSIARELVAVELDAAKRFVLKKDADSLQNAAPIEGVRLIHNDDPYLKADRDIVVEDPTARERIFPPTDRSPGYIPGAILVDGEVAGVWQRQQRKVTIHPWRDLPLYPWSDLTVDAVEAEASSFPIAGRSQAEIRWEPVG
jgi:hypothetical protein